MEKVTTGCCALAQIHRVGNDTPLREIRAALEIMKQQALDNIEVGVTTGYGQTTVFVIVSPGEYILETNLIKLGFRYIHDFKRRVGYPDAGDLKMYIKNLI